jgi:hypothetical protein
LVCRAFPVQVNVEAQALAWSGRCASTQGDSSRDVLPQLKQDAIAHYNAKADDLLTLRAGQEALRASNLDRHLPRTRSGPSFSDVLAKKKKT